MLKKYIRDKNNQRIGVIIADLVTDADSKTICIGFSLCNKRDKYDEERAMLIAENRLNSGYFLIFKEDDRIIHHNNGRNIPTKISEHYYKMSERAVKYYKL